MCVYVCFMNICTYLHVCVCVYSRYHTITDVCTTALLLKKPSSDDDSGFRHGFRPEASLPLAQSTPAIYYDTTRLFQIVVTYISSCVCI